MAAMWSIIYKKLSYFQQLPRNKFVPSLESLRELKGVSTDEDYDELQELSCPLLSKHIDFILRFIKQNPEYLKFYVHLCSHSLANPDKLLELLKFGSENGWVSHLASPFYDGLLKLYFQDLELLKQTLDYIDPDLYQNALEKLTHELEPLQLKQ